MINTDRNYQGEPKVHLAFIDILGMNLDRFQKGVSARDTPQKRVNETFEFDVINHRGSNDIMVIEVLAEDSFISDVVAKC